MLSVMQLISPSGSQNKHLFCSLRKVQLAGNLHTLQNVFMYCLFDSSTGSLHPVHLCTSIFNHAPFTFPKNFSSKSYSQAGQMSA